jgi:hypothetical protein
MLSTLFSYFKNEKKNTIETILKEKHSTIKINKENENSLNVTEKLYPNNFEIQNLENLDFQPNERYFHSHIQVDKYIYIFGGLTAKNYSNEIFYFDFFQYHDIKLSNETTKPTPKIHSSMCYHQKKLYLFGGQE